MEFLELVVTDIWNTIPISYIQKLYKSMPNRVTECCKQKSFPIKYSKNVHFRLFLCSSSDFEFHD